MPVTDVKIRRRAPLADGAQFGTAGSYTRTDGVLTFAVDPGNPANASIVDLQYASVDAAGRVRFEADFTLVAPADAGRGNRRLIVEVVNRGRRRTVPFFNRGPTPPIDSDAIPVGDGFLMRRGYSVLSVGWQWDVYRSDALLGLDAPEIRIDEQPVTGQCCVEIRPNAPETTRLLANRAHRPYPVANRDDPDALLTVRDWEDGPDSVIPRSEWQFARDTAEGIIPSAEHIYLAAGFQPGRIYNCIYTAARPVVVGCGMLAIREAASWLRGPLSGNESGRYESGDESGRDESENESGNDAIAGGFEKIYGHGVSQSGRLLRTMLYCGLNVDEAGRPVFDGLLPHVAGARRGEFNHRFAQPSAQSAPGFGQRFPFADNDLTDPLTEQTDGLLRRLRRRNAVPKIIYTDSAAEYWRGDASLSHIDAAGAGDLEPAPESRRYLFAGTQHLPGAPDLMTGAGPDGATGRHPYNAVDYIPLLRAALANLDRWASEGIAPPPSCHPRLDDGTAVAAAEYLSGLPTIPGVATPEPSRLWRIREVDLGADADRGIGAYPVREGREYAALVPAADADGNDAAGIRLPDLTVPVGTHTGWNLRHPDTGAPEQLMSMQGSTHWFARTAERRQLAGDPRPSLEERYAGRADYAERVQAAAQRLADAGYLLDEDVDTVVQSCLERYDCAAQQA